MSLLRAFLIAVLAATFVLPFNALAARSQDATTDVTALISANLPVTGPPFTMACWFKAPDNAVEHSLMFLGTAGSNFQYHCWLTASGNVSGNPLTFYAADTSNTAVTVTNYNTDNVTWQHACAVGTSTTNRRVYLNGVSSSLSSTLRAPGAQNRFMVGNAALVSTNTGNGQSVAHAAVWNVALTATEVANLAAGRHPYTVRPDALVYYSPCEGDTTNEVDMVANRSTTTTSSDKAPQPPLLRGGRR